jgi:hypothetical protein
MLLRGKRVFQNDDLGKGAAAHPQAQSKKETEE